MFARNLTRLVKSSLMCRKYGTDHQMIGVKVNEKSGFVTATLQRPPVNSLNLEFLTSLSNLLQDLENDKCRGLILTSSLDSVFSAGLDLNEIYKPNIERLKKFGLALQQMWIAFYGSSYPTVAVINGHSPAGGCVLALCCEYRIMLPNFIIGLNETRVGLVAGNYLTASMRNAIGLRQAEIALTTGELFDTHQALKMGLIDEIALNKKEGIKKAEIFLEKFKNVSPTARALTKKALRNETIQTLLAASEEDNKKFMSFITQDETQSFLKTYFLKYVFKLSILKFCKYNKI